MKKAIDIWRKQVRMNAIESKKNRASTAISSATPLPLLASDKNKNLKEGYLYELNLLKQWKQYYFVLKDGITSLPPSLLCSILPGIY